MRKKLVKTPPHEAQCLVLKERQHLAGLTAAASHMATPSMTSAAVDAAGLGWGTPLSSVKPGSPGGQGLHPCPRDALWHFREHPSVLPPSCPAPSTQGSRWWGTDGRPVETKTQLGKEHWGPGCRSGHQISSLVPTDTHLVWLFSPRS